MQKTVINTTANSQAVQLFLENHSLTCNQLEPKQLLADYLAEMTQGLKQSSSLKMIPTYISPDKAFQRNQATVVLDAGGSNLRRAMITLPDTGQPSLELFAKQEMPGLQTTISAKQFLNEIADFIQPVLEQYYQRYQQSPPCLGFCFSYSTQIVIDRNGNLDGKLLQWSKEIKVPDLVGEYIGSRLIAVLQQKFAAKAPAHIYIINDTVAALLAGQSVAQDAAYSDFIGYILGTGINSCYAEYSENIPTLNKHYQEKRIIINTESGNYSRFPQSSIDQEYDRQTQNPGTYLQEKTCSGCYWGELVCMVLRQAGAENLLPKELCQLPLQNSATANAILHNPSRPPHLVGNSPHNAKSPLVAWLDEHDIDENARERMYFLTQAILERNALFTAVNMAACIFRTNGGLSPLRPICLTIDGSTFYALHRFELRVRNWLDYLLEQQRYYRFKTVENAPLLGAAIAASSFT